MRLITPGLLASLLLASSSLARQAYVYIADSQLPTTATHNLQSLPASDARLVFAHRLGLSEFHSLANEGLNIPAIEALNLWGGQTKSLFGSDSNTPSQSIVFVEGFESSNDVLPLKLTTESFRFTIPDAPSAADNLKFVEDLQHQSHFVGQQSIEVHEVAVPKVEMLRKGHSGSDEEIRMQLQDFIQEDRNSIIVFVSPLSSGAFYTKNNGWGSYKSILRRQHDLSSEETAFDSMEIGKAPNGDLSREPEAGILQDKDESSNSTAPSGILPQCFGSETACKKTTNDCSGHGSCQSKYQYREDGKSIGCFACRCNATVVKTSGGKLTTYWSGPACQKRDVSAPFWLFVGLTIGLLLVVTWGIGLLYSVGQEDLPSVIGAGVAGPRPK